MNEKLKPEVRKMVAEECRPDRDHSNTGNLWEPDRDPYDKDALTRTAARLIKEAYVGSSPTEAMREFVTLQTFADAVSTNDTDALERLVAELKGFV